MSDPRLSVEVSVGPGTLELADLNAFSRQREAAYSTYYEAQSQYLESLYRDGFSSSFTRDGAFPAIDRSWTAAVHASYRLSPRFDATVGFDVLSRTRSGSVHRSYSTSSVNPDSVWFQAEDTTTWDFDRSVMSVRAYTSTAGLRWRVLQVRRLRIDAFGGAGVTWGTCRLDESLRTATTWNRYLSEAATRLRGHGAGVGGEAGVRAAWTLSPRWGLFAEASYARRRLTNITGTADRRSVVQDGDAATVERETQGVTNGRWRMFPYAVTTSFVKIDQPYPGIGSDSYRPFALDLSGARLRAGVTVRVGRFRPASATRTTPPARRRAP